MDEKETVSPLKARYNARKQSHCCVSCGKQDERTILGYTLCGACNARARSKDGEMSEATAARIQKRLENHRVKAGFCAECGRVDRSVQEGNRLCFRCRGKHFREEHGKAAAPQESEA